MQSTATIERTLHAELFAPPVPTCLCQRVNKADRARQAGVEPTAFLTPDKKSYVPSYFPASEDPVTNEMMIAVEEVEINLIYPLPGARLRNLGGAILLAAIDDYRSVDEVVHKDAEAFLYPRTRAWQEHFEWAVGVAEGLDPAWLRDALDRCKGRWDRERLERQALRGHRELRAVGRQAAGSSARREWKR